VGVVFVCFYGVVWCCFWFFVLVSASACAQTVVIFLVTERLRLYLRDTSPGFIIP